MSTTVGPPDTGQAENARPHPDLVGLESEARRFAAQADTVRRLQRKIDAEPYEGSHRIHQYWRQLDDGTYVSDARPGPGPVVVVERTHPADLPFICVLGRLQEMNPGIARWLSLRLAEAAAICEAAVIP